MPTVSSILPVQPSVSTIDSSQLKNLMKAYQTEQQLKYLHLQAEVEVLLQQLQTLKLRQPVAAGMEEKQSR